MKFARLKWQFALCVAFGACLVRAGDSDSSSEIILGMSTVLSGPAAELGTEVRQGVQAGLDRANRSGGINGRRLRLVTLDDGYEPSRVVPNMRQLIQKEDVRAVICNVGTPTAIAALPITDEQRTLFFAPFTGAAILRNNPPDRYVINFRASYAEETGAMIDALIDIARLKPEAIAFFTQRDGYGDAGFGGGIMALKKHGLKDEQAILHVRYERNTLAVENAVADLVFAETAPQAIIMVGTYAPCAKFIRLCQEAALDPLFLGVSFVGTSQLAKAMGKTESRVIITQVVPDPSASNIPIAHEYQVDLKLYDPSASPGYAGFEGYIAARILDLALGKISRWPTREAVVDALESLGRFDIGLGETLNLSPTEHQASHAVWPTLLQDGRFVPFQWPEIRNLVKKEPLS
jgi:branched-chain amino acid transport system substrate-binding protein